MDIHYQSPTDSSHYMVSVDLGEGKTPPTEHTREAMVMMICRTVIRDQVDQVRFFIDGSEKPIQMPGAVLKRLREGKLAPDDLMIGAVVHPRTLWDRPNSSYLLRIVPGGNHDHFECPACGGHARIGTTHLCCRCAAILPLQIRPMGVFANLVESLRQNPKQERWFINRPWNQSRPWMSRDALKKALGVHKEK